MKIIVVILILTASQAFAMDRFEALSMIESGDNDKAIGAAGEISRYQITPEIWKSNSNVKVFPLNHPELVRNISATNQRDAFEVAYDIQIHRILDFEKKYHREPTDAEWYLLWHRPARVLNPRPKELERAIRFSNLCSRPK